MFGIEKKRKKGTHFRVHIHIKKKNCCSAKPIQLFGVINSCAVHDPSLWFSGTLGMFLEEKKIKKIFIKLNLRKGLLEKKNILTIDTSLEISPKESLSKKKNYNFFPIPPSSHFLYLLISFFLFFFFHFFFFLISRASSSYIFCFLFLPFPVLAPTTFSLFFFFFFSKSLPLNRCFSFYLISLLSPLIRNTEKEMCMQLT